MADGWGMEIKYRLNIPNLKIGICKVRNLKLLRAVITLPMKNSSSDLILATVRRHTDDIQNHLSYVYEKYHRSQEISIRKYLKTEK